MSIRQKGAGELRITLDDTSKPNTIHYVSVKATSCWCSTYNAWGKQTQAAFVTLNGKHYRVVLEEVR